MQSFRRKIFPLTYLGISLLILFVFFQPGRAQTPGLADLIVVPEQAQLQLGQTLDVAVEIRGAVDLYAIDLLLEFDPQALEVLDMDPRLPGIQVLLGTFLDPGFVIANLVDNDLGRLRLAMTQLNPSTPKNGDGALMVVRFKGKALKQGARVGLIAAKLANPRGGYVDVGQIKDGRIDVMAQVSGPTSTPIPAQPAGTPLPSPTYTPGPPPGGPQPPTPTSALLFVQPTTTLVLAQRAAATETPAQVEQNQPVDTQPVAPTAAHTSTPAPTVAPPVATEQKIQVEDDAPGAPTARPPVATTTPQRRLFSGGENSGASRPNPGVGSAPLWGGLLALILAAGAGLIWKKRR